MDESESLITKMRTEFHAGLVAGGTLTINSNGIASIADGNNRLSVAVARVVAMELQVDTAHERAAGQTLGGGFEEATANFLRATFPHLSMLRPGRWNIERTSNVRRNALAVF